MRKNKPNYDDLGFADHMGPKLRNHVERQLAADLKHYKVDKENLKFDWSGSCVEGHRTDYLDGSVENFSGIDVFDDQNKFVAEGWMDFIRDKDFFLAYWHFLTTWDGQKKLKDKKDGGIPKHIWRQIPDDIKPKYKDKRTKK